MTEWRDPEHPVPNPEPAPGVRWAPGPQQPVDDQQDDAADPRHVVAEPQPEVRQADEVTRPDEPAAVSGAAPASESVPVSEPRVDAPAPTGEAEPAPAVTEASEQPASLPAEPEQRSEPPEQVAPRPSYTPVPPPPAPEFEAPGPGAEVPAAEVTAPTAGLGTGWAAQAPAPERAASQPTPPSSGIFRDDSTYAEPEAQDLSEEARKLAAERAARREAREAALASTAPVPVAAPAPVIVHKRTNDKFFGSLGLFLLRIVTAAIFAVRGLNILANGEAAQQQFAATIIPYPQIMAIVTGVACLLIALSLVLGLLTRVAGIGIVLIAGGVLAFVLWGPWSPFVAGQPGFIGEYELLLAAVGLLFLLIGGGGWSVDRSFRSGRERDRAERDRAERDLEP